MCVCVCGAPLLPPPFIHHCRVRPWGVLVTQEVNSEIAKRPHLQLSLKCGPSGPRGTDTDSRHRLKKHIRQRVERMFIWRPRSNENELQRVNTSTFRGWMDFNGDLIRNGILPFRCRVHRLDYTALLQCIPQQIKLNTRDYSVLWNTLDRDQCDLFFKFNLKRRRFEASYEKYSNALSQNRSESVLMKCDRYERKNNSTFLWSLCGVFVKSKALCSLGFAIKAVITFSNKLFKWIQKL